MVRMRAAVLKELHSPFEVIQVDRPIPESGKKLVELSFAGLNHRDLWITKGKYPGIKLPAIPGSDGAGRSDGKRILINPSLHWGDSFAFQSKEYKILGLPNQGTFAEYITIENGKIFPIPEHLSDEEAAALPLGGLTAYRAFMTKCKPVRGDKVLISGIGGGVATMAFLFSMALGLETYVTSGAEEKIEKAVQMGATGGVSYRDEQFHKKISDMSGGVDIVIDSAAGNGFSRLLQCCNPGARIAVYGGTKGPIDSISPQLIFWKQLSIFGSTMGTDREFDDMLHFVSKHKIKPVIDNVFSLTNINEAFKRMEEAGQFGKIILDVRS
jgi:zinc-binding alcohol dehydrogenase/oxidoreductase